MKYTITEMKGPFGFMREGDGRVVYLYNSTAIPFNVIEQVVDHYYTDTFKDDDGEECQDWSEYDPAILRTEMAGELEDEVTLTEIARRIDDDTSPTEKFIALATKEIFTKDIPLVFIDDENKAVSQLNKDSLAPVVEKLQENLRIFIREYDHGYDY